MHYIVSVLHAGGHGDEAAVALVTHDLVRAVNTAKTIKTLGYTIGKENGASVLKLEDGTLYPKRVYDFSDDARYPCVFWAGHELETSRWIEEWCDNEAHTEYKRLTASAA